MTNHELQLFAWLYIILGTIFSGIYYMHIKRYYESVFSGFGLALVVLFAIGIVSVWFGVQWVVS